ncbi:hypothetical protein N7478_006935 [Penicillium angulare]|uniref:uncharacterized protein n=1 Tax=Penicillium angulare TaxID=116970 RepID=UPI002541AF22|nr:uncharacterized protein N7478_006935 [Penicillium angulare]KAJ5281563.1 hypothetical protein N7478_006935 [Penicillium angulare]
MTSYEGFIELVLACAPNLHTLNISGCLQYIPKLTESFSFTRLQHLRISDTKIYLSELINFLRTTAPTLKSLAYKFVTLNDEIETGAVEDKKKEAERLWRIAWDFLRDEISVKSLYMTRLQYQDIEVRVTDRLRRVCGYPKISSTDPRAVAYNDQSAHISFGEWIDSLRIRPFIRTGTRPVICAGLTRGINPNIRGRGPVGKPLQRRIQDTLRAMREVQANEDESGDRE